MHSLSYQRQAEWIEPPILQEITSTFHLQARLDTEWWALKDKEHFEFVLLAAQLGQCHLLGNQLAPLFPVSISLNMKEQQMRKMEFQIVAAV